MFGFDFTLSANFVFLSTGTIKIQRYDENEKQVQWKRERV